MTGKIEYCYKKTEDSVSDLFDYVIFFPPGYSHDIRFPLIFFIHGAFERGTDLSRIENHPFFRRIAKGDIQCIAAGPLCPGGERWETDKLYQFCSYVIDTYQVDKSRVYLTGLSMGGFATWNLAAMHPELFAAIVPICGGGLTYMASKLKNMPIRAYHGTDDEIIPISKSYEMTDAVKAAGGNPQLVEMKGYAHDCWTDVYLGNEVYQWLLSHKKY